MSLAARSNRIPCLLTTALLLFSSFQPQIVLLIYVEVFFYELLKVLLNVHVFRDFKGWNLTGEMAQWLRVLAALPEDPGSIPAPHGGSQTQNSSSGRSSALFWPPCIPDMHVTHRHTCRQSTYTHKNNNSFKNWYWLPGVVCWDFLASCWYSQNTWSPLSVSNCLSCRYGPGPGLPGVFCGLSFTPCLLTSPLQNTGACSLCKEFMVAFLVGVVWEGHPALLKTVFLIFTSAFVSVTILLFQFFPVFSQFCLFCVQFWFQFQNFDSFYS